MLSWLANAWRVPELRRRVLFTAGILAAYRLGSWIPSPGVNASAISGLFGGGVLGLLSLFSGGALSRFSIFALGIMPYVTASIVIQLLTVAVPSLVGATLTAFTACTLTRPTWPFFAVWGPMLAANCGCAAMAWSR